MEEQSIVILDFGSQYTQLIARRIRELKVFSVVLPCTAPLDEIKSYHPAGIILERGPSSVYDRMLRQPMNACSRLGPARAWHLLRSALYCSEAGRQGGPGPKREYGHAEITVVEPSRLLRTSAVAECLDVTWRRSQSVARWVSR